MSYMPNQTAVRFYGRFGRVTPFEPELDPRGLARIRTYVGKPAAYPTWLHAARAIAQGNADIYPDYALNDWIAMATREYAPLVIVVPGLVYIVCGFDLILGGDGFGQFGGNPVKD